MNAAVSNTKTVPIIPVDADFLPHKNRNDVYRMIIAVALKEGLAPVDVNTKNVERLTMFLHPVLFAKIELVAAQHGISFQQAFAGLTAAGIESIKNSRKATQGIAVKIKAPFADARPEQQVFYQQIQAGISLNKIVLAEASTGVGKGRAICAAAIDAANKGKTPVVIAAPTLKVLGQLLKEMNFLREQGLGGKLHFGFFPGATEFVNEEKLAEFMLSHDQDHDVAEWLDGGGKMLPSTDEQADTSLRDALKSTGIEPAFLMDDLKKLAVNLPPGDFSLRGKDECETSLMLGKYRTIARAADIIFCTHTMLAISHRSAWSLLPEPAVLVIDEAHQFEQSVANIYSNDLSLFSLINRLSKKSRSPTRAVKAVRDFSAFVRGLNTDSMQINFLNNDDADFPRDKIVAHLENITDKIKTKSHDDVEDIKNARQCVWDALRSLSGKSKDRSCLSFSPDRRFPSIMSGKSDIRQILGGLWKTARGGAILCSATLYVQDTYGDYKSDYIADILSLPASRLHWFPPVIAKWVTGIPVMHIPTEKQAADLARPTGDSRGNGDAEAIWLGNIVKAVKKITRRSAGGTLILATSYTQVAAIYAGLVASGVKSERIILQERDKKMALSEQAFRTAYKMGLKPVWVALGGAWTGLDLSDQKSDGEDMLLTDLIIACCPIGLNRTNTMGARIDARHTQPIIKETLMMLKQGLGRLMRSENQKDRHIWFLDGRIWTDWPGMENLQKSVKNMLKAYKNQGSL